MTQDTFQQEGRLNKTVELTSDLIVIGGGMSGVCAAITAAREGIKVTLVQDRPVLGGNASSEVRLWILGATSHMGNNNRWAREGGVIDEILLENVHRNKEGNTLIFDTILLEMVRNEPLITLLLDTAVFQVEKRDTRNVSKIKAFCSINSTEYLLHAPLFCDASGDGIVAFQAGAAFRMGAESREEFDEKLAPSKQYGELLGHSIYFYSKKAPKPVKYTPPSYALKDITSIPRYRNIQVTDQGCRLWWIEYGGIKDTIYDAEEIKWELWKIVYGVWDYIKNSGDFEDVDDLTLEWVGTIPGKRESRRFEGEYKLRQQDIVEQRSFPDAVAFGGWALDLHPAEGIYSDLPGCSQWHAKGVYQIPFRSFVSKDIDNLFLAGRIISTTHVAFSSSRVMATCAHGAQAVGMAASQVLGKSLTPKELLKESHIRELQQALNLNGQSIPRIPLEKSNDPIAEATLEATSTHILSELPFDGPWIPLNFASAQMLPLHGRQTYTFKVLLKAAEDTVARCSLRVSSKVFNHTPDLILESQEVVLSEGEQMVEVAFSTPVPDTQYGFFTLESNEKLSVRSSSMRLTGVLSVFNKIHKAVSNNGKQTTNEDLGVEEFEFWIPDRRPTGQNLAMTISPALTSFSTENIRNGYTRPTNSVNGWMAAPSDKHPVLRISWDKARTLNGLNIHFDTDFDHPLESSLWGHPESEMPFCVGRFTIRNCLDEILYSEDSNYQTISKVRFPEPVTTSGLKIEFEKKPDMPVSVFEICMFQ